MTVQKTEHFVQKSMSLDFFLLKNKSQHTGTNPVS